MKCYVTACVRSMTCIVDLNQSQAIANITLSINWRKRRIYFIYSTQARPKL